MNWTESKIIEWNTKTFPHNPLKQLEKVQKEILEYEAEKRMVYKDGNHGKMFLEVADIIIASTGLMRYDEYIVIGRVIREWAYNLCPKFIDYYVDYKMEQNLKRVFDTDTFQHKEWKMKDLYKIYLGKYNDNTRESWTLLGIVAKQNLSEYVKKHSTKISNGSDLYIVYPQGIAKAYIRDKISAVLK